MFRFQGSRPAPNVVSVNIPQPAPRLLLIAAWDESNRSIELLARDPAVAATLVGHFGQIQQSVMGLETVYVLSVSLLYVFKEVVDYLTDLVGPAGVIKGW